MVSVQQENRLGPSGDELQYLLESLTPFFVIREGVNKIVSVQQENRFGLSGC